MDGWTDGWKDRQVDRQADQYGKDEWGNENLADLCDLKEQQSEPPPTHTSPLHSFIYKGTHTLQNQDLLRLIHSHRKQENTSLTFCLLTEYGGIFAET